jgi:hypothetical protein
VKLQFLPAQGQINLIQATADWANWTTVEQITGTGDMVTRVYGVTNGMRFFRLVRPCAAILKKRLEPSSGVGTRTCLGQ